MNQNKISHAQSTIHGHIHRQHSTVTSMLLLLLLLLLLLPLLLPLCVLT
jgi:hypothetical protein